MKPLLKSAISKKFSLSFFHRHPHITKFVIQHRKYKMSNITENALLFRQLFDATTSTYTYILADKQSKEAIIIDTVLEQVQRDCKLMEELGELKLVAILDTHVHADHVTGAKQMKGQYKNVKTDCRHHVSIHSGVDAANSQNQYQLVKEGDKIQFGNRYVKVLETPGHTNGCLSYVLDDQSCVFTGDVLLIRGCGRTDFQQGSAELMYHSIMNKLYLLPDSCFIYPGHDYKGHSRSTIAEEKQFNPRIPKGQTQETFSSIMNNLNLPKPKRIDEAVPANLKGGIYVKV